VDLEPKPKIIPIYFSKHEWKVLHKSQGSHAWTYIFGEICIYKNVIKLKKTCSNCPPLVIIYIMVVECEEEYYLVGFA
jgi:hypothetical protein